MDYLTKEKVAEEINSQETNIIRLESKINDTLLWKNVQTGDFIIIKKGERSPADILIFELSSKRCIVDTQYLSGNTKMMERFPISFDIINQMRGKLKPNELKKALNGKLEFDYPNSNLNHFDGYIKLISDPKGENINFKNMIFREEVLESCEYVFGMALHVGENTKVMQIIKKKSNLIPYKLDKIKVTLVFVCFILSTVKLIKLDYISL